MFPELLLRQPASLQVLIWEPENASVTKNCQGGTCSWLAYGLGNPCLFPWADSSTEIQQSVVLAFTFLAVYPSGRSLKKLRDQAELSRRPLHQGRPLRASESESVSAMRWTKQQTCLGRRSLRSWAAVPSALRPRPPNECVASK